MLLLFILYVHQSQFTMDRKQCVSLSVQPSRGLMDQKFIVLVQNILPGFKLTVHAFHQCEEGNKWEAYGHYTADATGTVNGTHFNTLMKIIQEYRKHFFIKMGNMRNNCYLFLSSFRGSQSGWDIFRGWTDGSIVEPHTSSRQQTWSQVRQPGQQDLHDTISAESVIGVKDSPIFFQYQKVERRDSHGGQNLSVPGSPDWGVCGSSVAGLCVGGALVHAAWHPQDPNHRGWTHCNSFPAPR